LALIRFFEKSRVKSPDLITNLEALFRGDLKSEVMV